MTDNEALAESIRNYLESGVGLLLTDDDYRLIVKALEQEPKTGHWINGSPICPCCGEDKFKDLDADIWADWQPKYCPNCGAKMDKGRMI